MIDYSRVSSLCDTALARRVEQLSRDLSGAHTQALNDWLERCVETWCPKAHACAKAGWYNEARTALMVEGFHWGEENWSGDRIATFWQGETPLARCRIDMRFTRRDAPLDAAQ